MIFLNCSFKASLTHSNVSRKGFVSTTASIRAGPSRCGSQCKTKARGSSEQWLYDVIVFSQPCYDRGRAQIRSTPL